MFRNMTRVLMVLLVGVGVTGCASTRTASTQPTVTRKVETRFYAEDRPRIDQEMEGNFGYITGSPQPEDRSEYRKTRRVYVLEVTKNVEEALTLQDVKVEPYEPAPSMSLPPERPTRVEPQQRQPIVIPVVEERSVPPSEHFEEYVIQDGDTLQKISKKFYGSFSQWTKIYDANQDVLKDPNRIRSGIRIRIPLFDEAAGENLK